MRNPDHNLRDFLAACTYPELSRALQIETGAEGAVVRYLRTRPAADVQALLNATYRLSDDSLDEDDAIMLTGIRELCLAHFALTQLARADDRFLVDPRRLYAHSDDDLFFIAEYARTVIEAAAAIPGDTPLPSVAHRPVAVAAASVLAALVARGYDPPPTNDRLTAELLGLHVMGYVLSAGDALDVIGKIRDLPMYAARCAAPVFARDYVPGFTGYDAEHAGAILAALMLSSSDTSHPTEAVDRDGFRQDA